MHGTQEINLVSISVYHNVFATSAFTNKIFFYDYEYWKILGTIELPEGSYPTSIEFIDGYSLIIICTSTGDILIAHM